MGNVPTTAIQAQLNQAVAGSNIALPLGRYAKTLQLRGRAGTRRDPIRITGPGHGGIARGLKPDFTWRLGDNGYAADDDPPHLSGPPKPSLDDPAFLILSSCSYVLIDGLTVRECWPSIFVLHNCHHIIIRNCRLEGGTYAIFVRGAETSHLMIEGNNWTQDTSPDHRLWHVLDWVEAHGGEGGNGTARQFNGGFLAGKGVAGNIVVRDNVISDAYNGIRLKCERSARHAPGGGFMNANVHIYGNTFIRIRDNPLEPEGFAYDWHVRHNRLLDCHSWFSFDNLRGGYWYFYGNTGTFETRQGIAPDGKGDADRKHTVGRVLKLSYESRVVHYGLATGDMDAIPDFPWYVAHNSWRLRCPIVGGYSNELRPGGEGPDITAGMTFCNNVMEWPDAPVDKPWLSTPMAPLRHLDFSQSENLSFDGSLWTPWGAYDYASCLPPGQNWERQGIRHPGPLFMQGRFNLTPASPGLNSAVPMTCLMPDGATAAPRQVAGQALHRGAVQDYGLVSFPDLEARAAALVQAIDPNAAGACSA